MSGSQLMAVDVKTTDSSFEAGKPVPLFDVQLPSAGPRNRYAVTRDGQRFLFEVPAAIGRKPLRVSINILPHRP